MNHVMIDLETLGTTQDSVILQIGAVVFDLATGDNFNSFNIHIDIQSCLDKGLKIDADTLKWWMTQDRYAIYEVFKCPEETSLEVALNRFAYFLSTVKAPIIPWGNGSSFDLGILSTAFKKCGITLPWNFWNERDVRTLLMFDDSVKQKVPFKGTKHNAIDDCLHQIAMCHDVYKRIKVE